MLKHARQLGRNRRALGPAFCQLTKHEYTSLLAGLEKLKLQPQEEKGHKEPEKKAQEAAGSGKTKRKLKKNDSDVSVDTTGLPSLFNSPFGKKNMQLPAMVWKSQLHKFPSLPVCKGQGQGYMQPWAMAVKSQSLERQVSPSLRVCLKDPARALEKAPRLKPWKEALPLEKDRNRFTCHKQMQTTLQGLTGNVAWGKKHLIVQVTAHQSPHYKAIAGKLRASLEKESLTKEEALEKRDELLAKYSPEWALWKRHSSLKHRNKFWKRLVNT